MCSGVQRKGETWRVLTQERSMQFRECVLGVLKVESRMDARDASYCFLLLLSGASMCRAVPRYAFPCVIFFQDE